MSLMLLKLNLEFGSSVPVTCALSNVCDANAACNYSTASVVCTCSSGFTSRGSPGYCNDINECLNATSCINGICTNSEGPFICECNPGTQNISGTCTRKLVTFCYIKTNLHKINNVSLRVAQECCTTYVISI